MSADAAQRAREAADTIYRAESRRVFATLVRLLGDFDLAEEALHDAFRAALEQWPRDGVPANPRQMRPYPLMLASLPSAAGNENVCIKTRTFGSSFGLSMLIASNSRPSPRCAR